MRCFLILIASFVLLPSLASAGLFKIGDRNYGSIPAAQQSLLDGLFDQLEQQVNSELPDAEQGKYLTGVANATIGSVKTLGADYNRRPEIFVVGMGNGIGVDLGNNSLSDILGSSINPSEFRGFGFQQTIFLGLPTKFFNLPKWGFLDFDKSVLYINGSSKVQEDSNFSSNFSNFGFHLQFPIVEGTEVWYGIFKWEGVVVTAGYEYTKMNLLLDVDVNKTLTENVPALGADFTMAFNGAVDLGVETVNHSIPIEVSTSVRTLYFMSFLAGLGADLSTGTSKSIASFSGPVVVTEPTSTFGTLGGTASLDLGDDAAPSPLNLRTFLGIQFNFYVLNLFLQANSSLTSGVNSVAIGVKSSW